MLIKVSRLGGRITVGARECGVRRRNQQASAGARHHAHLLSGGVRPVYPAAFRDGRAPAARRCTHRPPRWTRHGLNTGVIFWLYPCAV